MNQTINHIILLRVIAIILVVFAHATRDIHSPNLHMYTPQIMAWWEISIKHYIYSFHMPLFFWISGFVFYFSVVENKKKNNFLNQMFGKFKRLIIPLYATSFLVLLPTIFFFGHFNESFIHQIKLFILSQNNDHLWFLKTLFIIFIIYIPLNNFKRNDSNLFYITVIILWTIVYYNKQIIPNTFHEALRYIPFFIIGSLSRKYEFSVDKIKYIILFSIFFLLHLMLLVFKSKITIYIPNDLFYYLTAFMGIYFMYFFSKAVHENLSYTKLWILIKKVDAVSYSIYLFHVSFLYFILFINYKLNINIPEIRIALSFILGLLFPIYIHGYLSKHKILSYAFSIPFKQSSSINIKEKHN